MHEIKDRDPKEEATNLLPPGHEARVLEPSPPANDDPDWFADDPTDPGDARGKLVTPIPGEGILWGDLAADDPVLRDYVAENWLDGSRRLGALPDGFDATRDSLHQVAFFAIAPLATARQASSASATHDTDSGPHVPLSRVGFLVETEQVPVEMG